MAGRRHASEEIAAKLAQANELAVKGKTHREISKALGVSVMTYHRWKKMMNVSDDSSASFAHNSNSFAHSFPESRSETESDASLDQRLRRLELENANLRQLVIDMLLEMRKRGDDLPAPQQQAPFGRPGRGK